MCTCTIITKVDCTIHNRQCMYSYMFYCLVNMLRLYAENFCFVFFMLRERTSRTKLLLNPLPLHHLKFFREQIELWAAPCSIWPPLKFPYVLSLMSPGKSSYVLNCQPSHLFCLDFFWNSPQPITFLSIKSPVLLSWK